MILADKSPNFWTRHLRGGNRKIIKIPYLANITDFSTIQNAFDGNEIHNLLGTIQSRNHNESSVLIDHIDGDKNVENVSLWGNSFQEKTQYQSQEQSQNQDLYQEQSQYQNQLGNM
ncbi:hypothetical protein [Cryptosporidium hominis TU502]|nr:hypothetical protein [Cryptosporidium hominis TU502]